MTPREEAEIIALDFLNRNGPHKIEAIDSDDSLAAALLFIGLKDRGLVDAVPKDGGPEYRINDAGRAALASSIAVN